MGYYSRVRGRIGFDPPLNWGEIRALDFGQDNLYALDVHAETAQTREGELTRRYADGIIPAFEDDVKAYGATEDLKAFLARLPGRTFDGEFRIDGSDAGDVRRVLIVDGEPVEWRAKLLWPDGEEEPRR